MKIEKLKKLSILSASILMTSNIINLLPIFSFAESKTKDSIGSINMQDDGTTVGIDETQTQKTEYSDSIEAEGLQGSDVYVSQASMFGVTIPKTIILDGKKNNENINKANYIVTISSKSNFAGNEKIKVVPNTNFTMSQLGKNDIQANIVQDKIEWLHNEISIVGNGEISTTAMTAGMWKGSFNFNIELENLTFIKVEAFDENGVDLKATSREIKGEKKEQLLNSLEESTLINSKDEVNLLIDIKTNDFENMATTTFDVSSIAQQGDKVVILHFNETTSEWEYISTETVNNEGKITTNMSSFSPIAFVKVNIDGSFSEHKHIYNSIYKENSTCEKEGLETFKCYCGDTYTNIIEIISHNYNNNICEYCNKHLYEINSFNDLTWEQIATLSDSNEFLKYYTIGATKTFEYEGNIYNAEVVGVNTYNNNELTFMTKELLPTKYQMNSTATSYNGWVNSKVRNILNTTIYNELPEDLKNVIVSKTLNYETSYGSVHNIIMVTASDKLWLPTQYELIGNYMNSQTNEYWSNTSRVVRQHQRIYNAYRGITKCLDSTLIKTLNGEATFWWTASPSVDSTSVFHNVGPGGCANSVYGNATSLCGIPLCFVI